MKTKLTKIILLSFIFSCPAFSESSADKQWGAVQRITFTNDELPQSLYSKFTGNEANAFLQYCLPEDYSQTKDYPLVVYVPGFHGHQGGNIENAKDIASNRDCIVASLPLFKAEVDRSEVGDGVIVSLCDYPVLANAYKVMLKKFYQAVPNIDRNKSALVGFSNGAITIAVLVSSHDEYILERFHSYCMVDHGMFHLTDLHKSPTKNKRFLMLVGDAEDYGRELKLRGAKLVEDAYQLLNINLETRVLENTGHELTADCKADIGTWIFMEATEQN